MANVNPNPRTSLSQTRVILSYMREGRSITPSEARRLCGSDRLGARIMDIEKIIGYKPLRKMVVVAGTDALGNPVKKRVMSYWLREEDVV
jgi:hypothetical protein